MSSLSNPIISYCMQLVKLVACCFPLLPQFAFLTLAKQTRKRPNTLRPSGNCLPVDQGLRVINSVLDPRSSCYEVLQSPATGPGLKGEVMHRH
jgi:hypothetical protein